MRYRKFSLTAAQLRLLAMGLMLVDHIGRTQFPEQIWMVCLGRLAFPIFAFQAAEGYIHTRDFRRYCLRLAVFALVSEVPFNRMLSGALLHPQHQNVMLTLLLGLLSCRAWDRRNWPMLVLPFLLAQVFRTDYGALGVCTVLVFRAFRAERQLLPLMLGFLHCFGYGTFSIQSFAALSWLPICLYRGDKGRGGKWLQAGSYLFYPAHMLILSLL